MDATTTVRLLEWLEKKATEGVVTEIFRSRKSKQLVVRFIHISTLKPTREFEGRTLIDAIDEAWRATKEEVG